MPEIFLADIGVIAGKLESTEGTAETPAAGDAFLAEEISYTPAIQKFDRNPLRAALSPYPSVAGLRSATLTFKTLLKGSGTAGTAPEYGELFKMCKYSETVVASTSVTYLPVSGGDSSGTIALYLNYDASNGKKYIFKGCRGNFKFELVNGEPAYIIWEFTAADFTETDSAPLSGMSYGTASPLVFQNVTFTIDSNSFEVSKLDIDAGNELVLRQDPNQSSGYLSAVVTSCRPTGSFDPQDVKVATYDLLGKWRSDALVALSCALSGGAGNIVTVTAPKLEYMEVSPTDRDKIRSHDTNFLLTRNSGNDHLSIALT